MQTAACYQPHYRPVEHTVLVVDDEVLIRMLLADVLRDNGLEVLEAANADEALVLLDSALAIDVVLTDVRMEGSIDGLQLAQTVRANRPELKIVVASGDLRTAPPPTLADAFFPKPFELSVIASRIVSLLAEPHA